MLILQFRYGVWRIFGVMSRKRETHLKRCSFCKPLSWGVQSQAQETRITNALYVF